MKNEKKGISRRDFIKFSGLAAAATCLTNSPASLFGGGTAFASRKMKIGVIAPSHCALPAIHAFITGKYRKNGVDAEIVYLPDTLDIAKGIIREELDAGQLISPVFFAINAGNGPFKGTATSLITAQVGGTNGGVLVRGNDTSIRLPKDLAGKKIGVHSPLMVHSLLINTLLKRNKIDPAKDVSNKVVHMNDLIGSLKKGEIDAFINPEPLGTVAISKEAGVEMMLTKNLWFRHPCCLIAVRKDLYKNEPEMIKALYASSLESGLLLNRVETRKEALAIIQKDSKPYSQIPLKTLHEAFLPGRSDFDPFPYQSSGKAVMMMMQDFNLLPKSVDIDKMAADTLLSDLSRQLLTKLGDTPPKDNNRQEKIVGEIVV